MVIDTAWDGMERTEAYYVIGFRKESVTLTVSFQ